jgi:hypothetical protein
MNHDGYGDLSPRFIYKHGLPGETVVDLDYALVTDWNTEAEYIEHVSELDRDREFIPLRTGVKVTVMLNLFKYADPGVTYGIIRAFKGKEVTFYLCRAAFPFMVSDVGGLFVDALFCLKEITPVCLETAEYRDGLILEFESVSVEAMPKMVEMWAQLFDADGAALYGEDHKPLMVRI